MESCSPDRIDSYRRPSAVYLLSEQVNEVERFGPATFTLKHPESGPPNASIAEKSPSCPGL